MNPSTGRRGNITASDFANYRPVLRTPVSATYGEYTVHSTPRLQSRACCGGVVNAVFT